MNDSNQPRRQDARTARFAARHALRSITTVSRCFDCGREPTGQAVGVRQTAENVVGFAGLVSCGRVWLCPVCNAKVMARRALEVGAALAWATGQKHRVIFGSLTVRHNRFSDLAQLLQIQRDAWRSVVGSKIWRSHSATLTVDHVHDGCAESCERRRDVIDGGGVGRIGYIRAAEVTVGGNGWHPHFHPIIVYRGTARQAQAFADQVVKLWVDGVESAGGEARGHGAQQLLVVRAVAAFERLAAYITKATYSSLREYVPAQKLALEMVWSQSKSGRGRANETVSHWALLAAIEQGLADDALRWWELEDAVTGHRMITWSRGLRDFVALGEEQSDEAVAAKEVGAPNDTVCYITPEGWLAIRDRPALLGQILGTLEAGGWLALQGLLEAEQVDYFTQVLAL